MRTNGRLAAAAAAGTFSIVACSIGEPVPVVSASASLSSAARCAGGLRDEALVAYAPPPGVYTVAVPGRWARTMTPDGITFSRRLDRLRLEQIPYGSPSTAASFRSDELPGLRQATRGFRLRRVDTVSLPAGPAVLAQYAETVLDQSSGTAVERDVQRYELWRADQRMVLTMASPCEAAAAIWRRITHSFRWRR